MNLVRKTSRLAGFVCGCWLLLGSLATALAGDTVIVMPFENRSQMAQYNWVRESFALLINDILDVPGLVVISAEERQQAFEKMRLNPSDLLTRAAMIRVAEAANANLAVIGEYDIGGDKDHVTVAVTARLIETQAGRLIGNKVFNFSGPLSDLQRIQGQIAWHIVYERNPSLPYTKDQFINRATLAPPRAYESFVKAVQTRDQELRESFLRRALQEYESAGQPGRYAAAIYELGLSHYRQADFEEAAKQLKVLGKDDSHFTDGLFYLNLAAHKSGNFTDAAAAGEQLVEIAPLLEVLNNAGASAGAKGDLTKALPWLQRAVANKPNDAAYRFNYGYALWRNQNWEEAAQQLRAALKINPRDGEAYFILAKALASAGKAEDAAQADNEAKRTLTTYAKWAVAPDKVPQLWRLKEELPAGAFAKFNRQAAPNRPSAQQITQRQQLDRARQLLLTNNANNDAEALQELQQVLAVDGTNAEAHYLRAVVLQRRNQTESALSALQAAVSWNPRMLEAHIALGRVYLSRGDRALALAHCKQALELDPANREAIALKQQIENR